MLLTEMKTELSFDDLFPTIFGKPSIPGPRDVPEVEQVPGHPSHLPLDKMVSFRELVDAGLAKGFITEKEIVASLPAEYVESFVGYALDHDIIVLAVDPLSLIVKEKAPAPEPAREWTVDLFRLYQQEAWRFELLTAEEEVSLARAIKQGEETRLQLNQTELTPEAQPELETQVQAGDMAWKRFVEANLRLVVHFARKYQGQGLDLIDLIQEGNLGLIKSIKRWDQRRGYRFSTFASWWIRQAISRGIADESRLVRLPVHMHESIGRLRTASESLRQVLGREPNLEELAFEMGFLSEADMSTIQARRDAGEPIADALKSRLIRAVRKVKTIARVAQEPLSLDETVHADLIRRDRYLVERFGLERLRVAIQEGHCLGDIIFTDTWPDGTADPERAVVMQEMNQQMDEVLESLTARERRVVELRFGLGDGQPRTLEEVGDEFGVTRERIRQIQEKAFRKLQHPIRSRKLRGYLDLF